MSGRKMKEILNLTDRNVHASIAKEGVYDLDKKDKENLVLLYYRLDPSNYKSLLKTTRELCLKYTPTAGLLHAPAWLMPSLARILRDEGVTPVFTVIKKGSYKGIIRCSI